jgi:hypothetical protein
MILEFAAGNETGGWEMNYNATGDLIKITHLTTGTVATLNPVGNGVSQITDIRASTGRSVAGLKRLSPTLDVFVSRANAFLPLVIALPAFGSAAVGEFATLCAGIAGAGLGIIVANEAKNVSCDGNSYTDKCTKPDEKHCEALRQSILSTCSGLSGQARTRCLWVADETYRQCMSED